MTSVNCSGCGVGEALEFSGSGVGVALEEQGVGLGDSLTTMFVMESSSCSLCCLPSATLPPTSPASSCSRQDTMEPVHSPVLSSMMLQQFEKHLRDIREVGHVHPVGLLFVQKEVVLDQARSCSASLQYVCAQKGEVVNDIHSKTVALKKEHKEELEKATPDRHDIVKARQVVDMQKWTETWTARRAELSFCPFSLQCTKTWKRAKGGDGKWTFILTEATCLEHNTQLCSAFNHKSASHEVKASA
eukprot:2665186-Rhodomonas_salina.1